MNGGVEFMVWCGWVVVSGNCWCVVMYVFVVVYLLW